MNGEMLLTIWWFAVWQGWIDIIAEETKILPREHNGIESHRTGGATSAPDASVEEDESRFAA